MVSVIIERRRMLHTCQGLGGMGRSICRALRKGSVKTTTTLHYRSALLELGLANSTELAMLMKSRVDHNSDVNSTL